MEHWLEFEGVNVDDALAKARGETGRAPGADEFEILEAGRKGFLGLGKRRVRIRIRTEREQTAGLSTATLESASSSSEQGSSSSVDKGFREQPWPAGGSDRFASQVHATASRIVQELGLDLTLKVRDRDETVVVELAGPDAPRLTENDGEGIGALQHILNRILSRDPGFERRVLVDCGSFRTRHDRAIVERATKAAAEVRNDGRRVSIDGLNPYERRLIHLALSEDPAVRTYSTGEGSEKRLVIEAAEAAGAAEAAADGTAPRKA